MGESFNPHLGGDAVKKTPDLMPKGLPEEVALQFTAAKEQQIFLNFVLHENVLYYRSGGEISAKHFGDLQPGETIKNAEDIGGHEVRLTIEAEDGSQRSITTDIGAW